MSKSQTACINIKKSFESLRIVRASLRSAVAAEDFIKALSLKKKLEAEFCAIWEVVSRADKWFFKAINQSKLWEGIKTIILDEYEARFGPGQSRRGEFNISAVYEYFEREVKVQKPFCGVLTDKAYHSFLEKLPSAVDHAMPLDFFDKQETDNPEIRGFSEFQKKQVKEALHSFFLNTCIGETDVVDVTSDEVEAAGVQTNFASFLKRGTVIAGTTAGHVASGMRGGTLCIKAHAGIMAAYGMEGGTVYMENAGSGIGNNMKGGTVYARFTGDISFSARHGATVIFESWPDCYDKLKGVYATVNGDTGAAITNTATLKRFFAQKGGLGAIEDVSKFSEPTNGFEGGVLILRQAPESEIGKGQIGGIVIIEDDDVKNDLSGPQRVKELRTRLTKEPRGGVIFVRIVDQSRRRRVGSGGGTRLDTKLELL